MIQALRHLDRYARRHTRSLLLAGLAGLVWQNWRLWRRDCAQVARLLRERGAVPELARTPMVSALVAAWNEQGHIDDHLRSFLELAYPKIELIICAGGTDETYARAWHYAGPRVRVLEQRPGEGKQSALARCLAAASGEIVFLTDADCLYEDEALVRLLAPLINDGEAAATGGSRPLPGQQQAVLPAYLGAADAAVRAQMPAYTGGLLGRNAAVTRTALDRCGGLDFVARTGTDYQLAQRLTQAGLAIRYVEASVVASAYPETLGTYRRQQSRWLRNLLIHGWRYNAYRDVRVTLQTIATGAVMLALPLGAWLAGPSLLVPWTLLVVQATTSKLRYLLFAARLYRQPITMRLLVCLLPLTLIDFAIWSLPLVDLLSPRRRHRW